MYHIPLCLFKESTKTIDCLNTNVVCKANQFGLFTHSSHEEMAKTIHIIHNVVKHEPKQNKNKIDTQYTTNLICAPIKSTLYHNLNDQCDQLTGGKSTPHTLHHNYNHMTILNGI